MGVNEYGNAFGLLNWHGEPAGAQAQAKSRSRGLVIPHAAAFATLHELEQSWRPELFAGMLPFRLVGVFLAEGRLMEWRWNRESLERLSYPWKPRHWFSSGLSDAQAAEQRGEVCRQAWQQPDAGSQEWLRRLHRSHDNGPGPFSICVHRQDVGTLSYTEIQYGDGSPRMRYTPGEPCTATTSVESSL